MFYLKDFFNTLTIKDDKIKFLKLQKNITRTFYISIYMIGAEFFTLISFIPFKDRLPTKFKYIYISLYIFFLLLSILSLFISKKAKNNSEYLHNQRNFLNFYFHSFVFLSILWSAIITLLDQLVYGQIIAFAINYVIAATLFIISPKHFFLIEIIPICILMFALPTFQLDNDIIVGHYFNLIILITFITLSNYFLYTYFYEKELSSEKLKALSEKDEVTNLYNRRSMRQYFDSNFFKLNNEIHSFSILMIDVDFFKKYNDLYGHPSGDAVLSLIGNILNLIASKHNVFCGRYGGEEFSVIIKNKSHSDVYEIASEIQKLMNDLNIEHKASPISNIVTLSIGLYHTNKIEKNADIVDYIKQSDIALYKAKEMGRNQICEITNI